jgi:AAA15 family ATPase/GTPase
MRISKIHVRNFKRFDDLLIDGIPASSKLVLLIGSNGSGKSSLFDAFGFADRIIKHKFTKGTIPFNYEEDKLNYFYKKRISEVKVTLCFDNNKEKSEFTGSPNGAVYDVSSTWSTNGVSSFYGRTSFRQIPRLTRTALGQYGPIDFQNDSDRPQFFIERDNRFENDIEKITETIVREIFRSQNSSEEIRQKYIDPINLALNNIFGHGNGTKLELIEIIPPLEGKVAQITFKKGHSEIHYDYLSAGEKEVFNLLMNLLSRGSLYQDTIYYMDEMDLHLNTRLQFNLLKEITENWIPENCQLWTASHSLGFIEYAKQSEHASIIDFDDLDFDYSQILVPVEKDNSAVYEIAVGKDFLPSLFQNKSVIFVENNDKDFYANLGLTDTVLVCANDRNSVYHRVRTTDYKGLVDRDFLSDDDIEQIKKENPRLSILNYYSVENYLYHPDNLEEYYISNGKSFDKKVYISGLTSAKNEEKDSIIPSIAMERASYAYFGEPEYNNNPKQRRFKPRDENKAESATIAGYLNSEEFEIYYKVLPMKSYCTQLAERKNISKVELAKTKWFKAKIEDILSIQ